MSERARAVVVGVDGGFAALRAARWAGGAANQLGVPLHVVHATPYVGHNLSDAAAAIRAAAITEQRESADRILKNAGDAVRADFRGLEVVTEAFTDSVVEVLPRLSATAALIVLGCDEVTVTGALLTGSTTLAVVGRSVCPVVAWRGEVTVPTKQPIVVGVDGSRKGRGALATAFELADSFGAPLRAVHCWSTWRAPEDVTIPLFKDWEALELEELRLLSEIVGAWSTRYPNVKTECVVEIKKPSLTLLAHLADAQLVVVGTHGHNVLTEVLLGSTSLNMLHHSPVPVVLCRNADTHE